MHPPIGKHASTENAHQGQPVELYADGFLIVHHSFVENLFQHMFCGQEDFDQHDEYQDRYEVTVRPHLGLQVGMANGFHAPDADDECEDNAQRQTSHDGAVPPVVKLTVVEEIGNLQQQGRPKQCSQPVDAKQRKLLHEAEVCGAGGYDQQVDGHECGNEHVHVVPVVVVHQVGHQQVGQLHAAQYDDVKQGEEDGEVALGRHP